jgi:hypothetical protein
MGRIRRRRIALERGERRGYKYGRETSRAVVGFLIVK